MKKKLLFLLVAVCLGTFAMTACGNTSKKTTDNVSQEETVVEETAESVSEETAETESKKPKRRQKAEVKDISEYGFATFEVASDDLSEGVWDSVISSTQNGSNASPQLSWKPVDGAKVYAIYMIDTKASNWIHWMSNNITETTLAQGWASEEEYVGPYPPAGGTHTYEVYVVALKESVETLPGILDKSEYGFMNKLVSLNTLSDGSEGNILAYGRIVGDYTAGE